MAELKNEDKSIHLEDGSALKDTCRELGVPFGCENGVCGTCQIDIVEGEENLNELNSLETDMGLDRTHRLACQCKIEKGEVKIKF